MNLTDELIRNALAMGFAILQMVLVGAVVGGVILWFDVRSLKKAMNSAFAKIRELEEKTRCPK